MEETRFMSESINELAAALAQFQGNVQQPNFNKTVAYQQTKFRYADLAECQRVTRKPLSEAGLSISQVICGDGLITLLLHKSGQFIQSVTPIRYPQKMQDFGSMLTYLKRYSYCAILGIAADDDDDANGYDKTGKVTESKAKPSPKPRPSDKRSNGEDLQEITVDDVLSQIEGATTPLQLKEIYKANAKFKSEIYDAVVEKQKELTNGQDQNNTEAK